MLAECPFPLAQLRHGASLRTKYLEQTSGCSQSLSNLRLLSAMQGQAAAVIGNIKSAIQSNLQYFEVYNNLGVVQKDIGLLAVHANQRTPVPVLAEGHH